MLDNELILMVSLSKLVAVNEYLRGRDDGLVCAILDDIIDVFKNVLDGLDNSIQK